MPTTTITSGMFTFYPTAEYFSRLHRDITQTKPGDRVLLATMTFYPEVQEVKQLVTVLCSAAKRGVQVTLSIDAYNFLEVNRGAPLLLHHNLPSSLPGKLHHLDHALQSLQSAGVSVVTTNIPSHRFSLPVAGRSHAKISIINNKVYLGGCNLAEQHLDCMVAWEDTKTADWLYALFTKRLGQPQTLKALGTSDIRHPISKSEEIIFDVGVKQQSAIFEEALAIIGRAEKWLFITCQFFPNSVTAKHLKQAHQRGVVIVPVFNHYLQHQGAGQVLQAGVTYRERLRMPHSFFTHQLKPRQTFLHAKILASEQEAIVGSHNYVTAGVRLGTAEIALHSTAPGFGAAAAQTIAGQVDSPMLTQALADLGIDGRP